MENYVLYVRTAEKANRAEVAQGVRASGSLGRDPGNHHVIEQTTRWARKAPAPVVVDDRDDEAYDRWFRAVMGC